MTLRNALLPLYCCSSMLVDDKILSGSHKFEFEKPLDYNPEIANEFYKFKRV